MTSLPDIAYRLLLFEGVACFLLAAVFACRWFLRQPLDRIRLTQAGFGLIVVAAICIGSGMSPAWTIALPMKAGDTTQWSSRNIISHKGTEEAKESPMITAPFESFVPLDFVPLDIVLLDETEPQERQDVSLPAERQYVSNRETHVPPLLHRLSTATLWGTLILPPLFLLLRDGFAKRRLHKLLRHSTSAPEDVMKLFRQISGNARCKVRLKISERIAAPMVFGVFRAVLLLPAGLSRQELRACLMHEWSHLKNGDLMTWNCIRLFQYPLWMQPFYWLLRKNLLADQDYLADDDASSEVADYAGILFDFAQNRRARESRIVLGMAGRKSLIRRRIDMLLKDTRPARRASKRKLLVPLVLLTALALLGGTLRFGEAQTEELPASPPMPVHEEKKEPGSEQNTVPGEGVPMSNELMARRVSNEQMSRRIADAINRNFPDTEVSVSFDGTKIFLIFVNSTPDGVEQNKIVKFVQDIPAINGLPVQTAVEIRKPSGETAGGSRRTSYIIESLDVLNIEAVHMVPKPPYLLKVFDIIMVNVVGTPPEDPICGAFAIEPGGTVQLGPTYGSVKVEGLSAEQAKEAVKKYLSEETEPRLINPIVAVNLARMGDMQKIVGNRTVDPDGYITLGSYGRVYVNGLTVEECKEAVEFQLAKFLDKPQVIVEVAGMSSKTFYVIIRTRADRVMEFPYTGNETVLSAIAVSEIPMDSAAGIKLLRPGEGEPMVKSLTWDNILSSRAGTGDNVKLLPGDRIVVDTNKENAAVVPLPLSGTRSRQPPAQPVPPLLYSQPLPAQTTPQPLR